MLFAAARRRLAVLRQPRPLVPIARVLWVAWAVLAWNVVFDHVIVVAGRQYIHAAGLAEKSGGPYARMDDWMRPAVTRAFWTATLAAAAILAIGLVLVRAAARPLGNVTA